MNTMGFVKENLFRAGLLITATLVVVFSGIMLYKIGQANSAIYNNCEERRYVGWTKEVQEPISNERRAELLEERQRLQYELNVGSNSPFIRLQRERDIEQIGEILETGYEVFKVPDEERREHSRLEAENYEKCIKSQQTAQMQRPELYKSLYIGNGLILVSGVLFSTAFRRRDIVN